MKSVNLTELLEYIDPASLEYQDWLAVGMALKTEGYSVNDWESWSSRDPAKYHAGECARKWAGFHGSANPVTGASITQLAKENGWRPQPETDGQELDWDAEIGSKKDHIVVDHHWIETVEISEPGDEWDPSGQLIKYLETLFEKSENVGYVCETWEKDGKMLPTSGCYDRTAEALISGLKKCGGDIGAVFGDYNTAAGAWIRFNPLDGNGVKNDNVTAFRFALVESDTMPIDKQNAVIRELELPVACLVHSGGKSLHAIVRIDAANYEEYRKRVDYLYNVCSKNGFKVDSQNRNPSRLSRMPGIVRNGHKQFIVDANIGKSGWDEWVEWIDGVNDDLPEPESMASVWDCLPDLSPPLIDGVLRQGHKMLLAGPSKAGKSYSLIQLCCAIAEGKKWINWLCTKGKVMYVNLELDRASCLHRFRDVYEALGWKPDNIDNIDIWNLRGKSVPMDKLAPKLIRRAHKKNYIAIIIDPIYKVITGDENSADQMAHFCNQFDRVCNELGAAVVYCHHHSKGSQGQKRSMDRASGSGVFARDPDALLDLIELEISESLQAQMDNRATCDVCAKWLNKHGPDNWEDRIGQDDVLVSEAALAACRKLIPASLHSLLGEAVKAAKCETSHYSGWRIEGTLREFPKFEPVNLWFMYPIHKADTTDMLKDVDAEGDLPPWKKATDKRKHNASSARKDKNSELETAIASCNFGDPPTKKQLAEFLNISERSVSDRLKAHGGYSVDKNNGGIIVRSDSLKNAESTI